MDNIIKIQCREDIVERINQTLKRLEEKGFSGIFNGNNFDLIDNQGKCLNSEYGIDFYGLEEYSEKVVITNTRTKKDRNEIYNDHKYENGRKGIIKEVTVGEAYGIGECLMFEIEIEERYISDYIAGDFELI